MRALRWATPVVLAVLLVLVLTGRLSPCEAIVALVVVEAAMALGADCALIDQPGVSVGRDGVGP